MNARYYNPTNLARFMSVDHGNDSQPGDPQSWNKFAYVRNNPMKLLDPSGMNAQVECTPGKDGATDCTVTATLALYPGRESISDEQMAQYANDVKSSIETAWTGSFTAEDGTTVNVRADVSVTVVSDKKAAERIGADNIIGISEEFGNQMQTIKTPLAPGYGTLKASYIQKGVAGHEFGHMMGMDDTPKPEPSFMRSDYLITPGLPQAPTNWDFQRALGLAKPGERSWRHPIMWWLGR